IIYASLTQESVSDMFIAGVLPGLILAFILVVCSYFLIKNNSNIVASERSSFKEIIIAFKNAAWGLMAPVIILGGIYSGIFTPTESAGVAVVYGLFVGIYVYKEISIKEIIEVLTDAATSTAVVMYIVAFATLFAWLLTTSLLAQDMADGIISISDDKILILLFFLDTISAYFILIPIILPVATSFDINPIHLGVFMTINLAVGQFTPPVGVNLFVASNIGKIPIQELLKYIIPYIFASLIAVLIITYIPWLSLWLPSLIGD